jgi:hypothetical protein
MFATGPSELTVPAKIAAMAYVNNPPGSRTHARPVAVRTTLVRRALAFAPMRSAAAPPMIFATIDRIRPMISTVAALAAVMPHRATAYVARNGTEPYWHTASTLPTAVGRLITSRMLTRPLPVPGARSGIRMNVHDSAATP